jgi:hypothetical protein
MMRSTPWLLLVILSLVVAGCRVGAQSSDDAHPQPHGHDHAHGHSHSAPGEHPTAYPDRIALTWSEDPASSLSVTWRTDTTVSNAVLQVALARAEPSFYTQSETIEASTEVLDLSKIEGEHVKAHYHAGTATGLQSDTLYAYRVGDGDHWSEWFHTRTASDRPAPMSFIYFGDAQNNVRSHWSRAIRAAYQEAPDARFMIHAGDLVNNAHRNIEWGQWHQAGGFIQSMLPNVPVPGNHEYDAYETWVEPGTFTLSATVDGDTLHGTVIEPDNDTEVFAAARTSGDADDGPAGAWHYVVDNGDYSGTMRFTDNGDGFSGTIVNDEGFDVPRPDRSFPIENVTVTGDSLSATFQLVVEKEGTDYLSAHWRPGFTLPTNGVEGLEESTYYLDIQGVRVIGLNSNIRDEARLQRQTAWLEETLQSSNARWTVVTFHHPMFSSGEGRSNTRLRERWTPIFDEHQVDLVLQGHDHTYARGRLQNLTQGVNTRSPVGGTVYVNSVSGAKMYEIKPDRWERYEGIDMERGAENTQLFQVIRVDGDTLRFHAYTVTGELYDAFDLVKRPGDAPNRFIARVDGEPERTHENTMSYTRPSE